MKLSAILLCVAASSLVACADVETTGGGQGEGIVPTKTISFDPSGSPLRPGTTIHGTLESTTTIHGTLERVGRAHDICEGCEIATYRVVDTGNFNKYVQEVSDGTSVVCRIYLNENMVVLTDECGRH